MLKHPHHQHCSTVGTRLRLWGHFTRTPRKHHPAVTGLAMRLKRERQTGGADASFKSSAFMSSLIESTRPPSAEYAEMYVAAVRSWLRSEWWAPQRRRLA